MAGLYRIFCTMILMLLTACSAEESLPRLSPDAVILAFGDSLTYGTGASAEEAYPARLAELSGFKVINAGVPGEESVDGMKRLPALLDEIQPSLLILCEGGNDMIRKRPDAEIVTALRAMIEMAQQRGVAVLLVAVPKPGMMVSPPRFYSELAEGMRVPIEEDVLSDILSTRSLKSDTIHPNADGYRQLANEIYLKMKSAGAL